MAESPRQEALARFQAACEDAAQRRAANKDLRLQYRNDASLAEVLRKELIADLRRVYEDPDNPHAGFAASRKRYRQLGHYPEVMVEDFFGNHEEFLRAADLGDKRNTTRVRNKAARLHTHQQVAEYADREVRRYHHAFRKDLRKDHLEVMVGSDFHSAFVDPFAMRVWLDSVKMVQPDVIVLNGDVFDFPQISRHRKLPGHFHLNLQEEIDFGREKIMRATREAAPDAEILMVIGNHEARLVNYLADTAPHMASLRTLRFGELFGLDDLEIGLVCRQSFLTPTAAAKKRDQLENWTVIGDSLVVTHGVSCAKFAADEQLKRYQISGSSGHTHRPQIITANSLGTGALSWTSTPMMAGFAVGHDYVSEPSGWNMGFGIFSVLPQKKLVCPSLVIVHEEFASFAGRTWAPTKEDRAARRKMGEI